MVLRVLFRNARYTRKRQLFTRYRSAVFCASLYEPAVARRLRSGPALLRAIYVRSQQIFPTLFCGNFMAVPYEPKKLQNRNRWKSV